MPVYPPFNNLESPCRLAELRASLVADMLEKAAERGVTTMVVPACGVLFIIYPAEGDIQIAHGNSLFSIMPKAELQIYGEKARIAIPLVVAMVLAEASQEKAEDGKEEGVLN